MHNLFLLSILFTLTPSFHIYVSFVLFPVFKNLMVPGFKTYRTHPHAHMLTDMHAYAHIHMNTTHTHTRARARTCTHAHS